MPQVDPESWQRETELIQQDNLDPEVREALPDLDRETAMIAQFRGKPIRLEQHERNERGEDHQSGSLGEEAPEATVEIASLGCAPPLLLISGFIRFTPVRSQQQKSPSRSKTVIRVLSRSYRPKTRGSVVEARTPSKSNSLAVGSRSSLPP
jgi:hypothetical protein